MLEPQGPAGEPVNPGTPDPAADAAWAMLVAEQARTRPLRRKSQQRLASIEADLAHARRRNEQMLDTEALIVHLRARVDQLEAGRQELLTSDTWRLGESAVQLALEAQAHRTRKRGGRPSELPAVATAVSEDLQPAYDAITAPGRAWHAAAAWSAPQPLTPIGRAARSAVRPARADAHGAAVSLRALRLEALAAEPFSPPLLGALLEAESAAVAVGGIDGLTEEDRRSTGRRGVIAVDVRCLQDDQYVGRGVGKHAKAVLSSLVGHYEALEVVGLVHAEGAGLPVEIAGMLSRTVAHARELAMGDVSAFVSLSPMTSGPSVAAPFLVAPWVRCVAVVYDFIPYRSPWRYLADEVMALAYEANMLALGAYDLLLPISAATAAECVELLGVSPAVVRMTGVADPLGDAYVDVSTEASSSFALAPTGGEARKDLPCALLAYVGAVSAGADLQNLVIVGHLPEQMLADVRDLVRTHGLDEHVQFRVDVPNEELAALYAGASVVLVPSHAEGFSLPVAEAVRRGTPVVASDIAPHRELLGAGPWLARRRSPAGFAAAILAVLADPVAVLARQKASLGDLADVTAVQGRLTAVWPQLTPPDTHRSPQGPDGLMRRPTVVVVSPWRPQISGVSDFTAHMVEAFATSVDVTVASEAAGPVPGAAAVETLGVEHYLDPRTDVVLSVLGNSTLHLSILELLRRFGGAALAHDARLFEVYLFTRGAEATKTLISSPEERLDDAGLHRALLDLDRLPRLGFHEVVPHARPLVVHSEPLAVRLQVEEGRPVDVVPFVPYTVPAGALSPHRVRQARRSSGLGSSSGIVFASFGLVDVRTKRADLIVAASAWLHRWKVEHALHFVGPVGRQEAINLSDLASELGCPRPPVFHGHVPRSRLEDLLLGVDVAVQLRSSLLGVSGALADCVAHGVPTVATRGVAVEVGAPGYVTPVERDITPMLLAEKMQEIARERSSQVALLEPLRTQYLEARNIQSYASRLLDTILPGGEAP